MISRIEALNYRGLRHVSQDVRPFEVLVGPNASGKSTFLDVPAFISDFVREGLDAAVLFSNGASTGRARRLDEVIFNHSADQFQLALNLAIPDDLIRSKDVNGSTYHYDTARYDLIIGRADDGELDIRQELLWFVDAKRSRDNSTIDSPDQQPWIILRDVQRGRRGTSRREVFYTSETDTWSLPVRVGLQQSALANLPEDPERFPVAIWVRDLLLDGILKLALNSAAMRRPVGPSASRSFDVEGANLPLVIQDLQKSNATGYGDWVAHIQTILPDIQAIQVYERAEDRFLYLAVQYAGLDESIPSWLVSDGTLRLMALTLLPYLPDESRVYLVEEPEDGIHPRAIEGVYQSLSSVYNGQVLVATHSPLFLGLAAPAQLLVFSKDSSGAVRIVRGDQHPALENWRGQTDLSTLYAAGVLG